MVCKACGAEIAEKALICYKCGTATFDSVRKPAPLPASGARTLWWAWGAAVAAVASASLGPLGADVVTTPVAYVGAVVLAGVSALGVVRSR
jgi:hypothetical protein